MSLNKCLFLLLLNICIINSIRLIDNDFFTPEMKNLVRKIHRLSFSTDNKTLMFILVRRLNNLINTRIYERPEVPRDKYIDIGERKNIEKDAFGTYDIYSQENVSFDRGYQMSFETIYDHYDSEEFDEIAYKMSLMTDNHVYLGIWATGIELSFHVDDFEFANVLCILYNQMAMFDWSVYDEINNPYFTEYDEY